ncbi:MAG TPA: hypothetical protein VMZ53_03750 [Kofleriaceae bacterium]|nr:hypothetical protein [Kofleriaceae bacterium]
MTTQETSRESYRILIESGKLRGKQAQALEAVMRHGPATSGEIIQTLGTNVNLWRARFTELQGKGLIVEVGQRKCTVTGRSAIVWQYSGRTKPLELQHRAGTKQLRSLLQRVVKACDVNGMQFAPSKTLITDIRAALQ